MLKMAFFCIEIWVLLKAKMNEEIAETRQVFERFWMRSIRLFYKRIIIC